VSSEGKRGARAMTETKLIVNLTRGHCLCVSEVADGGLRRMRGLIGRRGLPAGEGLLLSPAPAIHTAFMRFPIDALFLDRDMRVLDIVQHLRPWRVASKRRARAVLELSAGECARRGVEVGDRLELRERSANGAVRAGASPGGGAVTSGESLARCLEAPAPELSRLQPLRVLVLSGDRQFRTVVSLLLARRNCSVTTTANAVRLGELIVGEHIDVAVIDASAQPATAAVATVQTLPQPVGLVLVADEVGAEWHDPPALPKWGPFGDLLEAIEGADTRHLSLEERR
jgi:uncharacterized protein